MPEQIPDDNVRKAMLAECNSDKKVWKAETKKIDEQKSSVFSLTIAQLSESPRSEKKRRRRLTGRISRERDLLYLVTRTRATHIARQSGHPAQDKERVQMFGQQRGYILLRQTSERKLRIIRLRGHLLVSNNPRSETHYCNPESSGHVLVFLVHDRW